LVVQKLFNRTPKKALNMPPRGWNFMSDTDWIVLRLAKEEEEDGV
jgi:hypothetical protein